MDYNWIWDKNNGKWKMESGKWKMFLVRFWMLGQVSVISE